MTSHRTSTRAHVAAAAVALLLLLTACHYGPNIADFPPATQAAGADVQLASRGWKVSGELVAVRDTALLVRAGTRLVLVPWARVQQLELRPRLGVYDVGFRRPNDETFRYLRLVSRFPQDLTPEVERALLAALGRSAIEVER